MRRAKKFFWSSILVVIAGVGFNACSPASPKLKPEPLVPNEKIVSANNEAFTRPSVDILFVIDDSGSMSSHQTNLKRNTDLFVNEFTKLKLIDYHMAVTSTTVDEWGSKAEDGHLSNLGGKTYIDRNTMNGLDIIKKNMSLGTGGGVYEKLFDPVALALSPPLVNGYNQGFYRPDAHLVIIYVTDTEDQSRSYTAQSFMDFLINLKNNNKNKILSYAAYVPVSQSGCPRDDSNQGKLEKFLDLNVNAGKNRVSLCDPSFGQKLVDFSKEIVNVVNKPIILSRPPVVSSIKVMYGTQEIPSDPNIGWTFDPIQNAIVFGPNLKLDENQPQGTGIDVSFDSAYYPGENP